MENWSAMVSDDRYEVSDQGRVRRKDTGRVRKPSSTPTGYKVIVLYADKTFTGVYVHREVMRAFVGECPEGCEVSHLNGNNADNRLVNLNYESRSANMRRKQDHGTQTSGEAHPSAKLCAENVREIRTLSAKGFSQTQIAKFVPVSSAQVGRVLRGECWTNV
jgi:hypothetical protein